MLFEFVCHLPSSLAATPQDEDNSERGNENDCFDRFSHSKS